MMTELGDLTNVVAYQSSDSQIHREFAPTLKSVANAGDPRFEYSPTDGQSVGLLIESQATNLQRYGSAFNLWNTASNSTVSTSQAIAPNGALEANLFVPNSTPAAHFVNDSTAPLTSGTTYTGSVYIKSAGKRYAQLIGTSGAFGTVNYATFDLQTGSVDTTGVTASAQNVGNGWWRIIVSATANNTTNGGFFIAAAESATSTRNPSYAGNDYDGLLIWGFQIETGSSASSLANSGTSSSGVTRASDSCSVATSSFGFTGGPMSLVGEASGGLGAYPQLVRFRSSSSGEIASISKSSPSATDSTVYGWGMTAGGSDQGRVYAAATTGDFKLGAVADTNRLAIVANGNSPITDSSAALFDQLTVMDIGNNAGINQLNGHIKRLALYNVALSDTELQALTS
jgi:hypothetical protein